MPIYEFICEECGEGVRRAGAQYSRYPGCGLPVLPRSAGDKKSQPSRHPQPEEKLPPIGAAPLHPVTPAAFEAADPRWPMCWQ